MTVIVWDGKTLAADRMLSSDHGPTHMGQKIFKHDDCLLAFVGKATHSVEVLAWWIAGHDMATYPRGSVDDCCEMYVVYSNGQLVKYSTSPFGTPLRDKTFTAGCGAEYAAGALAMGADAKQACEIACGLDIQCGHGIDTLEF
jgi:hypothetical protein